VLAGPQVKEHGEEEAEPEPGVDVPASTCLNASGGDSIEECKLPPRPTPGLRVSRAVMTHRGRTGRRAGTWRAPGAPPLPPCPPAARPPEAPGPAAWPALPSCRLPSGAAPARPAARFGHARLRLPGPPAIPGGSRRAATGTAPAGPGPSRRPGSRPPGNALHFLERFSFSGAEQIGKSFTSS
jgi:hypothetical protein